MGKAERNRQERARLKVAAMQAAQRRAEARRRGLIAGGSVALVLVVVVGLIIVKSLSHATPARAAGGRTANATVAQQITDVPVSVMDKVGAGPAGTNAVSPLKTISSAPLTMNGKPEMLYIGAEYCPFCAAERWAMTVALSRFGTFTGLHFIHSASADSYSNTATLTFYKSTYTSKYVAFRPIEMYTVSNKPLETPTKAEMGLLSTYGGGSFPFVDIDGKYTISGSQFQPGVLGSLRAQDVSHFGLTWTQIAKDMQDPTSPVAQAIIGAANHITAAICKVTNGQPGSVCTSPAVTAVGGNI